MKALSQGLLLTGVFCLGLLIVTGMLGWEPKRDAFIFDGLLFLAAIATKP